MDVTWRSTIQIFAIASSFLYSVCLAFKLNVDVGYRPCCAECGLLTSAYTFVCVALQLVSIHRVSLVYFDEPTPPVEQIADEEKRQLGLFPLRTRALCYELPCHAM